MTATKSGFLIGLGSNIEPFKNFPKILQLLLKSFEHVHLSRVLNIPPVGMNSQHFFLNAVAFVETDMAQSELKALCNQIETRLGRDREDPNSKQKDRPADLDILCHLTFPDDNERPASSITDEYFLYPLIDEIKAFLCDQKLPVIQAGSVVSDESLTFGETATTIDRNDSTGHKGVR